ncbi:MAG: COX15/CtaA family protein [Myxococcota bacterium]|nr:COX15/CtaA family protein [Myxococcota bacterium]
MKSTPIQDGPAALSPGIARGFALVAALTFCLIVVGALVRANDAGLACPDWPLCHGEFVPAFDLKVAFEWGHRVFAFSISVCLVVLSILAWRDSRVRGRVLLAASLLAVQIVFGGLTVLLSLAPWTVGVHLVLGNLFCVALLWISRDLAEDFGREHEAAPLGAGSSALVIVAAAVLLLQMILGGWVSSHYAGLACTDFPTCNGEQVVPTLEGLVGIHVLHRLNAFLLFFVYGGLAVLLGAGSRAARLARLGCSLVVVQIAAGVANVLLQLPIALTALHSGLAAAIVLVTAMLVREVMGARAAQVQIIPKARMVEAR